VGRGEGEGGWGEKGEDNNVTGKKEEERRSGRKPRGILDEARETTPPTRVPRVARVIVD